MHINNYKGTKNKKAHMKKDPRKSIEGPKKKNSSNDGRPGQTDIMKHSVIIVVYVLLSLL